jgi:hypothetical protein
MRKTAAASTEPPTAESQIDTERRAIQGIENTATASEIATRRSASQNASAPSAPFVWNVVRFSIDGIRSA